MKVVEVDRLHFLVLSSITCVHINTLRGGGVLHLLHARVPSVRSRNSVTVSPVLAEVAVDAWVAIDAGARLHRRHRAPVYPSSCYLSTFEDSLLHRCFRFCILLYQDPVFCSRYNARNTDSSVSGDDRARSRSKHDAVRPAQRHDKAAAEDGAEEKELVDRVDSDGVPLHCELVPIVVVTQHCDAICSSRFRFWLKRHGWFE